MEEYEDKLESDFYMDMDPVWRLGERFPWLDTVEKIAAAQGFFHWELRFASVFAEGGFDIQVGNPPWVRPTWEENSVMAEFDPWFELAGKPSAQTHKKRKAQLLAIESARSFYLTELISQTGRGTFFGSAATYDLLAGTQPDLYRAFMCRTWRSIGQAGVVGLLHPDSHFGGSREGALRAAAYHHLRVHGSFVNAANWAFEDLGRTLDFGLHVYGQWRDVKFQHLSQLYAAETLPLSLTHDGSGDIPAQKHNGTWDKRPHLARVINVDSDLLAEWNRLTGDSGTPTGQAPLLYPITVREQAAISDLASFSERLSDNRPELSAGYHEKNAKDLGIIRWEVGRPTSAAEVILQGTHFGISTPYAKEPNEPFANGKDWVSWDLNELPQDAIPRTTYVRACDISDYRAAQDSWDGRPYTDYYRMAWRVMIDPKSTERSLFASLVPPGPAHVDAVMTTVISTNRETALNVGFWSSLPLDYMLRITGRSHLRVGEAYMMPRPVPDHSLSDALLLRALRLNCLTTAYVDLWAELFKDNWRDELWAVAWPNIASLNDIRRSWELATPLRTEHERRCALVEIDALVAVWLGMSVDQLIAIYRSRYPILADREDKMWFDSAGRRIAGDPYAFGYGQAKEHWKQFQAYLEAPAENPPPDGYAPPFYKADRIAEYRQAHAAFTERTKGAAS